MVSLVRLLLLQATSPFVVLLVTINGVSVSAWTQQLGIRHTPQHGRTHVIPTAPIANHHGSCTSRGTIPSYQIHSRDTHGTSCYRTSLAANGSQDNSALHQQQLLGGRISTPHQDLKVFLDRMIAYFESMVDPDTNRFFLLSYPQQPLPSDPTSMAIATQAASSPTMSTRQESFSHVHCPLRDLGSAWDATKSLKVRRHYGDYKTDCRLKDAILQTTKHYSSSLVSFDGDNSNAMHVSQEVIGEPPNIAHNALLLVTLVGSEELNLFDDDKDADNDNAKNIVDGLAQGILFLQQSDGAFRSRFDDENDDVYGGIEFFPGEAMTALMEVYLQQSRRSREPPLPTTTTPITRTSQLVREDTLDQILPAMLRALQFYRAYYEEGRNQNIIDANYSIWQVQAFARLVVALQQQQQQQQQEALATAVKEASEYCLDMCTGILRSPAWKLLSRGKSFYPNLSTVEIACGLDTLYQGAVVLDLQEQRVDSNDTAAVEDNDNEMMSVLFARHIDDAVAYLQWSQDRVPTDAIVGYGGLGHGGYCVMEQRLDVTGHALSAVANLVVAAPQ